MGDHACTACRKSHEPPLLLNIPPPMIPEMTMNYERCGVNLQSRMHILRMHSRKSETHVGFAYGSKSAKPVTRDYWKLRSPTHFSCGCSVIATVGILCLKGWNGRLEMIACFKGRCEVRARDQTGGHIILGCSHQPQRHHEFSILWRQPPPLYFPTHPHRPDS
jgi:hypothetical protein